MARNSQNRTFENTVTTYTTEQMIDDEWLEADGLGGFASGTISGIRTRRYHALLLTATQPPTGRFVLVNGFDASVETANGTFAVSSQLYLPDLIHPGGAKRIVTFSHEPWPKWVFALADGTKIRLLNPVAKAKLAVKPLFSGRDYHSLHHENPAFRFQPEIGEWRLRWHSSPGVPGVVALHNGAYRHQPDWYHNFTYEQERERGLDFTEDLAAPGSFEWDLRAGEACLLFAAEGHADGSLPGQRNAAELASKLRAADHSRRVAFATPLDRAADAYWVKRGTGKTIVAGYPWFAELGPGYVHLVARSLSGHRSSRHCTIYSPRMVPCRVGGHAAQLVPRSCPSA
ncbi:MAG TPA: glycogen debranching enzyme N-terminal domain-containing protein [Terriglobales bacterium]|nr:glycogen debranching enzyme N-terminal domain-containing protein [Terriglobales bacterium]